MFFKFSKSNNVYYLKRDFQSQYSFAAKRTLTTFTTTQYALFFVLRVLIFRAFGKIFERGKRKQFDFLSIGGMDAKLIDFAKRNSRLLFNYYPNA